MHSSLMDLENTTTILTRASTTTTFDSVSVTTTTEITQAHENNISAYDYYDYYSQYYNYNGSDSLDYYYSEESVGAHIQDDLAQSYAKFNLVDLELPLVDAQLWDARSQFINNVLLRIWMVPIAIIVGFLLGILFWSIFLLIRECCNSHKKNEDTKRKQSKDIAIERINKSNGIHKNGIDNEAFNNNIDLKSFSQKESSYIKKMNQKTSNESSKCLTGNVTVHQCEADHNDNELKTSQSRDDQSTVKIKLDPDEKNYASGQPSKLTHSEDVDEIIVATRL